MTAGELRTGSAEVLCEFKNRFSYKRLHWQLILRHVPREFDCGVRNRLERAEAVRQHLQQARGGDLAEWTGTNEYEVLTNISARVPRLYIRE